ncbi:MAG: hypothetical protein AAB225_29655, partial [Acidobacteriota bacterium]
CGLRNPRLPDRLEPRTLKLYRSADGESPVRLNAEALRETTDFLDSGADFSRRNSYFVRPVINGEEQPPSEPFTLPANPPERNYLAIRLRTDLEYGGNHVAVGDLDGDGEYDFVVKRGSQDIDPSQSIASENTFKLERYKRDGTFLWRVDLGWNIEQGIWYSPFIVYDLDGDGRAEVVTKIGEVDEDLDGDGITDYRNPAGRVLAGPEYFVVIDGLTGEIRARENWIARGNVSDWGDNYGNRVNRNLMAVAYLDGEMPSLVIFRGTYTQMFAEAWNFRDGQLSKIWRWERPAGGGGYHNVRTGDIDGDGRDEIINGSIAIDDDGSQLWITGEGHGDRLHMTDIDPDRPGLESWYIQEGGVNYGTHLRDARTGELIWGKPRAGDIGRGLAADIDPHHKGLECWASAGGLYNSKGEEIGPRPGSVNFAIWWDGDLLRELLDGTRITKYQGGTLFSAQGTAGPRNAPMGYGDILGDWREEVWYIHENRELRIYTTTIPATNRLYTLMHDADYRISVACETMGYMQATQPSFYVGAGMEKPAARPWRRQRYGAQRSAAAPLLTFP